MHAALSYSTDQSDGIYKVKVQLPGIYVAINPWQLGFNYYLMVVAMVHGLRCM